MPQTDFNGTQPPVTIEIAKTSSGLEPRLGTRPLATIVRALHDTTVDDGLAALAIPGLTRETLEPVLTYCAEKRCVADNASCPGCRRATSVAGLKSFDDFVACHKEIVIGDGAVRLQGKGETTLQVESLNALTKTWAGEEYWYWARRVLRKFRHGVRDRANPHLDPKSRLAKPAIILVEPQLADNIGMVARAMANFGIEELRLVAPRDGWPNEKARIAASGATFVIEEAVAYPTFQSSLNDLNWVCATTARQRDLAKPVLSPEQAVAEMLRRISEGQRVGIIFGRERNGLETSEIAIADAIVMAPVDPHFASLNLAQSVLLIAYEWIKQTGGGSIGRVTTYETPLTLGEQTRGSPPATKQQLTGFFEHIEAELDAQGFLNPPHKRPTMVQNMRSMFSRMQATEQEVRTLRGIVKALVHGKGPGRRVP